MDTGSFSTTLLNSLALANNSRFDWTTTPPPPSLLPRAPSLSSYGDIPAAPHNTTMGSVNATPSGLMRFEYAYSPVHGVLAPIVCVLGILANCLNTVILTRKNMVTPTNILLAALAISDGLTMAAYLPYAILNYHVYKNQIAPFANVQYLMFFAIFSVIVHSISIWLTVSLAVFRYIFIRYPRRGAKLCTLHRAHITVAIVCVVVTVVCIPNSVSYEIRDYKHENKTGWYIDVKGDSQGYVFLKSFNLWVQAVLIQLLPCCLLSVLSILLIKQMKMADRRRKKLLHKNGASDDHEGRRYHRKTNRTTRMLVVVVVLFVVTETPQGILKLLAGVVDGFFDGIYGPLGDVMDSLALFNNGINFVLYCAMSKQFRDTFIKVFLPPLPRLCLDPSRRPPPSSRSSRKRAKGRGGEDDGGGGGGGGDTMMLTTAVPTQRLVPSPTPASVTATTTVRHTDL